MSIVFKKGKKLYKVKEEGRLSRDDIGFAKYVLLEQRSSIRFTKNNWIGLERYVVWVKTGFHYHSTSLRTAYRELSDRV